MLFSLTNLTVDPFAELFTQLSLYSTETTKFYPFRFLLNYICYRIFIHHYVSMSVVEKLPTYPSPNLTLTLTSRFGQNVRFGEG